MSEERLASVLREFVDAVNKKDVEKALSYFQDDASYQAVEGTFKGKSEIKRYLTWATQNSSNHKLTDAGIGLLVKGNTVVYENDLEGTYEGKKFVVREVSIVEFKDEKFQSVRGVSDRVSLLKQLTKGWMATRTVNSIVNTMEKGLH
jgi:ketosteroid isomerase-like protein